MNDASLDKNKGSMQEQDMEEQHRRVEEEASGGPLDEREQEIVECHNTLEASSPSDMIDASSDLNLQRYRTYDERVKDFLQVEYFNNLVQSEARAEAMSSNAEEHPSQFDFDFEGASFYGYEEEWLLYQVRNSLLQYPDVRSPTLVDFQDGLKEKTTYEFDVNEVGRLVQLAGAFGVN